MTCEVSFLVPHPERTAVLVRGPGASLPSVSLDNSEPSLPEILTAADLADLVALRQVMTWTDGESVALLLECDATAADGTWLELDEPAIAALEPGTARPAVAAWARERAAGWDALRPEWSRPGWFAKASGWMVSELEALGCPALAAPQQHHLWGLTTVLRAPTARGSVFFKTTGDHFRHEAAVTAALAALLPDVMPEVIAVDEARGWLLMRDLAAPSLGEQDESLWAHGLVTLAGIQHSLSRTAELARLGVPVRSLPDLAASVSELTADAALVERMGPELTDRWNAAAPSLIESCLRLDALGPGPTLVHGDFHPWNVVHGEGRTRIFDWSDAALSHPFVDLATYVFRTKDVATRRAMLDAYLATWSDDGSLREAAELALVVGALFQVQTYRALLPTLMHRGADDDLANADLSSITRALDRHEQGIESE